MLEFLIGLFIGSIVGVFIMCLLVAAKEEDKFKEYMKDDKNYYDGSK